jgi:hypothetical protein
MDRNSVIAGDERYVYFKRPGAGRLRIYDSLRRRIRLGPRGCPDQANHGVLLMVCHLGETPVLYRVRDGRTLPIRGLDDPNADIVAIGRYWLDIHHEGDPPSDEFVQWHTGESLVECCFWSVDLDSREPRRDPEAVLIDKGALAVELPYALRERASKRGIDMLVLTRRHRRSILLGRSCDCFINLVARRVLWTPGRGRRWAPRRAEVQGYDIRRRRSVSWRVRNGIRGLTLGSILTRYQALVTVVGQGRFRLFATKWPAR